MTVLADKLAAVLLALAVVVAPVMACCCGAAGEEAQADPSASPITAAPGAAEHACCMLSEAASSTPSKPMSPAPARRGSCGCDHTRIVEKADAPVLAIGFAPTQLPPLALLPAYPLAKALDPAAARSGCAGHRSDGLCHMACGGSGGTLRAQSCLLTV